MCLYSLDEADWTLEVCFKINLVFQSVAGNLSFQLDFVGTWIITTGKETVVPKLIGEAWDEYCIQHKGRDSLVLLGIAPRSHIEKSISLNAVLVSLPLQDAHACPATCMQAHKHNKHAR